MRDRLAIVVPCYNEEEVLPMSIETLMDTLSRMISEHKIAPNSFLLFVNDGSRDKTWTILKEAYTGYDNIFAIQLARNVGHQNALLAGLCMAKEHADMVVSIDADLQDDVNAIGEMVDAYRDGCDIVYGVRSSRKKDSLFKRQSAQMFYRFLSIMGVETVYNHADFRLMSKRALEELSKYEESNLYLRGMIPLLGYQTRDVLYERKERMAGESKYPLKKMLSLAFDGITSFSTKPITMIVTLGVTVLLICLLAAVYAFVSYYQGNVEKGWTSLILSIWFIGGVQLISIGIIGEYIGKIYKEVKKRPKYNIETFLYKENGEDK
ncbi:MAG TPA: glycosyltransferase family 2 protein [Lachnospiraceae bacterium]|nr:glycosyltransferase family 2 protein [Lachnospiraceae bacterium]HPF29050.1 glycosyltransferase family 2 protein [Lachnospiraceae bacterium]